VLLVVSDDGCGMGTGFGLATVYCIVKKNRLAAKVREAPDQK
jgi:hypothetical protein